MESRRKRWLEFKEKNEYLKLPVVFPYVSAQFRSKTDITTPEFVYHPVMVTPKRPDMNRIRRVLFTPPAKIAKKTHPVLENVGAGVPKPGTIFRTRLVDVMRNPIDANIIDDEQPPVESPNVSDGGSTLAQAFCRVSVVSPVKVP